MSEYVEIDAQELNDYISNLEDENEALKAQVEQLQIIGKALISQAERAMDFDIGNYNALKKCANDFDDAIQQTPAQCLAARDAEVKALAFEQAGIPKKAKAGCIGEFKFTIEDARCCPECYNNGPANDCEMCGGESGESGVSDLTVSVPWDLCKEIWLAMNQFAANELRQQAAKGE